MDQHRFDAFARELDWRTAFRRLAGIAMRSLTAVGLGRSGTGPSSRRGPRTG
jgi:hypothetical protein